MSSAAMLAPQVEKTDMVDVWAAAVDRGLTASGVLPAPAMEWSQCSLDKLELGEQKWRVAEVDGESALRIWIGVPSFATGLDSLSSALSDADNHSGAPDLSSDDVVERILVELVEVTREEREEELSLRSIRQAQGPPPAAAEAYVARTDGGRILIVAAFERSASAARQAKSRSVERASFGQLLNIDLPLSIRLGRARMPIEDVLRLKVGSLVELDRAHDDPVDLIVNGAVVARGDLVAVDGVCGLRVREVLRSEGAIRIEGI